MSSPDTGMLFELIESAFLLVDMPSAVELISPSSTDFENLTVELERYRSKQIVGTQ